VEQYSTDFVLGLCEREKWDRHIAELTEEGDEAFQ